MEQLQEYYGVEEIDELLQVNTGDTGELTFEQFVRVAKKVGALEDARALREEIIHNRSQAAERKRKHAARYDEMLSTFSEWRADGREAELVGAVDNERLRAVLAGCFAGARNEGVVKALKILYVDYGPLRMGGDLIFKLMNQVVKRVDKQQPASLGQVRSSK